MAQNTFYPNFRPALNYLGGIGRAVLGIGGGKFSGGAANYQRINQRLILMDVSPGELMKIAMRVPHLNTVISTGAELFSLMVIKHLDKNGEEVKNSDVLKFLRKPNPVQSQEQYLHGFYVFNGVYGKTFQHKIGRLSFERIPAAMWLLPSGWMRINATGKVYRQTDINEIVESYVLNDGERMDTFEVDKVIYMAEGIGDNILNPASRIESLQIPLSNIVASLKSRNIIVSERGMIGVLSPKASGKDGDGALPPDSKEAIRLREAYQNTYDLDSRGGHVNVSSVPMEWNAMTYNIHELGLVEGVEADFGAIIDAFRHDRDMYSSVKGATFENKAAGMRSTIQNALQPLADKLMRQFTEHFIDPSSGETLVARYDHLPSMKEDELKRAQVSQTETLRLSNLYKDGVITLDQYALLADVDFETLKNMPQNAAQSNLRGLVGSVTGIIQVNQFVAQGFIDKGTGVNILMSVYGYDAATASAMITTLTVDMSVPAPSTTIAAQ